MSNNVTLTITAGLPYSKLIVMALPAGRSWWTTQAEFEVLMQIREDDRRESPLVLDMTQYLVVTMPDADTVSVNLTMTGEETRDLVRSGFYDVFVSDPGTIDARGNVLIHGQVKLRSKVTAEAEDLP